MTVKVVTMNANMVVTQIVAVVVGHSVHLPV